MTTLSPEIDLSLPAAPAAAREARRALADSELVEPEQEHTLLLLVSELVANSVRHAGLSPQERIRLRCRCDADVAHVEVCDPGRAACLPRRREAAVHDRVTGGFGLNVVDAMADRWGVDRRAAETCVWFELARAGADA